jgi:hypothetical protein
LGDFDLGQDVPAYQKFQVIFLFSFLLGFDIFNPLFSFFIISIFVGRRSLPKAFFFFH